MPVADVGDAAAAVNGRLHAIGGMDITGGILSTVEEYDPATDTWATKASMPTGRLGLGVAAGSNGKRYAIGGSNAVPLTTVEEYDPATNLWAAQAAMPTAHVGLGGGRGHQR